MVPEDKNSEEKILDAAKEVFTEKGFDGTRMEEISQRAGINKALLHYYYRSKEKLFNAIFELVMGDLFREAMEKMTSDIPLFEKIEFFVEMYINLLRRNPHIPVFVISELHRNPQRLVTIFKNTPIVKNNAFEKFAQTVRDEIEKGTIEPIEPEHLIVNILGLCIFPIIARPIIQTIIFKEDKKVYEEFIESRKKEVAKFVIAAIKR
jgi:TetR/AcrR family transcriptional regulator